MAEPLVISGRAQDLGGFSVRRVLPYARRRMVGPFLFFDHMGPADFPPGEGIDVRPHPHIHLATVTYLFEGKIHHRDSLGSDQFIEPGAINWMTAGHGIVHSERTPPELRARGYRLDGIQCWIALPREAESLAPSFRHYPKEALPEFTVEQARLKLLLGEAFGQRSPVPVHSDLFYLDGALSAGASFTFHPEKREGAVYLARGRLKLGTRTLQPYEMAVLNEGEPLQLEAAEDSRFLLLGGAPVGERFMYWNFVSSSREAIREAAAAWASGPGPIGSRFPKVPGDEEAFIPLPEGPIL